MFEDCRSAGEWEEDDWAADDQMVPWMVWMDYYDLTQRKLDTSSRN